MTVPTSVAGSASPSLLRSCRTWPSCVFFGSSPSRTLPSVTSRRWPGAPPYSPRLHTWSTSPARRGRRSRGAGPRRRWSITSPAPARPAAPARRCSDRRRCCRAGCPTPLRPRAAPARRGPLVRAQPPASISTRRRPRASSTGAHRTARVAYAPAVRTSWLRLTWHALLVGAGASSPVRGGPRPFPPPVPAVVAENQAAGDPHSGSLPDGRGARRPAGGSGPLHATIDTDAGVIHCRLDPAARRSRSPASSVSPAGCARSRPKQAGRGSAGRSTTASPFHRAEPTGSSCRPAAAAAASSRLRAAGRDVERPRLRPHRPARAGQFGTPHTRARPSSSSPPRRSSTSTASTRSSAPATTRTWSASSSAGPSRRPPRRRRRC
jgi:hypothetical protein